MINLHGKTALIVGGSRGIGRAIALLFAQHGCNIAFTYQHSEEEAHLLQKQILSSGVQAICIQSNAADYDTAHQEVQQLTY